MKLAGDGASTGDSLGISVQYRRFPNSLPSPLKGMPGQRKRPCALWDVVDLSAKASRPSDRWGRGLFPGGREGRPSIHSPGRNPKGRLTPSGCADFLASPWRAGFSHRRWLEILRVDRPNFGPWRQTLQ